MRYKEVMHNPMFSSATCEWSTPQYLFDELNEVFDFTLDPCATSSNAKCAKFYTKEDNGLIQDWSQERVFCNPPYGRDLPKWVEKSYYESRKDNTLVVMLIPARTDTTYWHKWIFPYADIIFIKGRLKFGDCHNSAPFPSALVIFNNCGIKYGR